MPFPNVWIYRVGLVHNDSNSHRSMFSQTWVSTDPPPPTGANLAVLRGLASQLKQPFGSVTGLTYNNWNTWSEEVYPRPHLVEPPTLFSAGSGTPLNTGAPEAAFRLQRVGATVTGSKGLGRVALPILTDAYYTDLPHRRHVDVSTLAPLLATGLGAQPLSVTAFGRTYVNSIFSRWSMDVTPVVSFRLLENPIRIWQRQKVYPWASRHVADQTWKGPVIIV